MTKNSIPSIRYLGKKRTLITPSYTGGIVLRNRKPSPMAAYEERDLRGVRIGLGSPAARKTSEYLQGYASPRTGRLTRGQALIGGAMVVAAAGGAYYIWRKAHADKKVGDYKVSYFNYGTGGEVKISSGGKVLVKKNYRNSREAAEVYKMLDSVSAIQRFAV